jgi:hypothetical protein
VLITDASSLGAATRHAHADAAARWASNKSHDMNGFAIAIAFARRRCWRHRGGVPRRPLLSVAVIAA